MRVLWLLLLVFAGAASALFPIESTFVETFLAPSQNPALGNQTVEWQQNTLTFQCSSTNQQGVIQVGNLFYTVTCNPPQYSYDTTLRGFVPSFGTLYSSEICLVDTQAALGNYNITASTANPPVDFPTGRRLLSFWDTISNAFDNYVGGLVCTASLGFSGNCDNNNGGGGMTTQVRDALINQANKLNSYIANMTVWQTATSNAISALQNVNINIQSTLTNQQAQLATVMQFSSTLNNTVAALAKHQDALANQVNTGFQGVYSNISFLGKSLIQTDASVSKLQNATFDNFQKMATLTSQMQTNQNAQNLLFYQKIHGVTRLVKTLAITVQQETLQTNLAHAITAAIFGQAQKAAQNGEKLLIHPQFPGQAPATNFPDSLRQSTLDKLYISITNSSSGIQHNYQIQANIYCNIDRVAIYGFNAIDYEDVYDIIGPAGCASSQNSATALANCLCWIEVSVPGCQTATGFRFDSINDAGNRNAYTLQSSMCQGGVAPSPSSWWNSRLFDSVTDFNTQILGPYACAATLATASPPLRITLWSARVGFMQMLPTPSNEVAALCSNGIDLYNVFESTQYSNTIPFNFYRTLVIAYSAMWADDNPVWQYEYGFPPNYVTYTQMPFNILPNNQTYTCYRSSIMGYSTTTQPAFTIVPSVGDPVTTTVTVVARDANNNVVSSQTSASVAPSVPLVDLLPPSGSTVFGIINPEGFSPPTSVIYDYVLGTATVGGPRQARAGQLTYPLQPIPNGFDITNVNDAFPATAQLDVQFAQDNGALFFNHEDASYTLDQVSVPFQFNAGAGQQICVPPASHVDGWLCTLLSNAVVVSPTDMRNGKLVFAMNEWTYTVTMNVVMGEVVQRVYPGCADISFATYSNGLVSYTLTNSLPNEITNVIRIRSTTCTNPGDLTVDLLAKQIYTANIARCGQQTLQQFQIQTGGSNTLLACGPPFNLTVNPNSQANLAPATNQVNTTFIVNTVVAQTQLTVLSAATLFTTLAPLLTPTLTPNYTNIQRQNLITQALITFVASAMSLSKGSFVGNVTAEDVYASYLPTLNGIANTFNQEHTQGQTDLQMLNASIIAANKAIAIEKKDLNASIQAGIALEQADNQLITALVNDVINGGTSINSCPLCPDIIFIYELCCAIDHIVQFIANVLVYVGIIAAVIGAGYGIYRLIRYCQAERNEEAEEQETEAAQAEDKKLMAEERLQSHKDRLPPTSGMFTLQKTRTVS